MDKVRETTLTQPAEGIASHQQRSVVTQQAKKHRCVSWRRFRAAETNRESD